MLFYTATIIISLSIIVPIIILVHKLDSVAKEDESDFSFDERVASIAASSDQKYNVRPVNLDYAKPTNLDKQLTVKPIREETPASNDKSFKIVPKIVTLEFARKPLCQKVSEGTH